MSKIFSDKYENCDSVGDESESSIGTDEQAIIEKIEGIVHFGAPVCDVCRNQSPEERDKDPLEEFWPSQPIRYINANASALVEWDYATVCPHHDRPGDVPEDVTHRVETRTRFIGDEHRMKSAYKSDVTAITGVDCDE